MRFPEHGEIVRLAGASCAPTSRCDGRRRPIPRSVAGRKHSEDVARRKGICRCDFAVMPQPKVAERCPVESTGLAVLVDQEAGDCLARRAAWRSPSAAGMIRPVHQHVAAVDGRCAARLSRFALVGRILVFWLVVGFLLGWRFGGAWVVLAPTRRERRGRVTPCLGHDPRRSCGSSGCRTAEDLRAVGSSPNFGRRARACRPSGHRRFRCRFADSATTSEFGREQHQPPPTSTAHDRSPPPAFRAEGSSERTQPRRGRCAACRDSPRRRAVSKRRNYRPWHRPPRGLLETSPPSRDV